MRQELSDAAKQAKEYAGHATEQARQYGRQAVESAGEYGNQALEYGRTAATSVPKTIGKIPVETYLLGALGSIGISLSLKLMGRDRDAEFVGHWAPTFLTLGLLSKLIQHDEHSHVAPQSAPRRGGGRR